MNGSGRRKSGFSLLEIMFALTIVAAVLVGLFSAIFHVGRLNAANRENLAAMAAAQKMAEALMGAEFERIFAAYNENPADDPAPGPGTAPGPNFDVWGLTPQPDDPDGKCGRILFPTNPSGTQLREDVTDSELMMPRDLDGNGQVDATDVSSRYRILPVSIRIDWQGVEGRRSWTYRTMLLKKR